MRFFSILLVGLFVFLGSVASLHADMMDDIYQLTDQKKYDTALKKLNEFLKTNPKDAQARFLKGLVLTEKGQRDEAITIFSNLSQDYPDLPEPYNNLAVLYAEKGKYEQAKTALQKAIKAHPTYATAHENLGDIYAKMASRSYNKALSMSGASKAIKTKIEQIKAVFASHTTTAVEPRPESKNSTAAPSRKNSSPAKGNTVQDDLYDVEMAVEAWVKAWSALDINGYLDSYSKKFQVPPRFPNYNAWVQNRKRVIGKANSIRVSYDNLQVRLLNKNLARAEFKQSYWSPNYQDKVNKTLSLARESNGWKIVWERSDK